MHPSSTNKEVMNLAGLPSEAKLFQLLSECQVDHELVLTECADGALIMECFDCPFRRILDEKEEKHLRETPERLQEDVR